MKKRCFFPIILMFACIDSCAAMTLEGSVEQYAVIDPPPQTEETVVVPRPYVEGHVGVRISATGFIGRVHPGSPADLAGLRKDDRVTLVDWRKHRVGHISGDVGTTVHLHVKRKHEDIFEVDLERVEVNRIAP